MRQEIRLWSTIIFLFLVLLTALIFYLLRKVIKYYKAPDEILPQQVALVAANTLIPPIPSILIVNNYISRLPAFEDQFVANDLLYPAAILATLIALIILIGLIIEYFNVLANSEYRNFRIRSKKDS